jgi:tRNA(His) guanylyltransferase
MIKDDLGNRMKSYYEEVSKTKLVRRMPVIIRIDGKAFHTFTRGMLKPFDDILINTMQSTTKYLCEHIQGCKLGYTQSDEISLLITDYDTLETNAWFDYEVQKMSSIAASMATMAFNYYFEKYFDKEFGDSALHEMLGGDVKLKLATKDNITPEVTAREKQYITGFKHIFNESPNMAVFDARCFNLPKEEVTNYFYWRQLDAMRNSVNMVGQFYFSQKQMEGKSVLQVKEMLKQLGEDWDNYAVVKQRGSCVLKQAGRWCIDVDIPIFKEDNRKYIDSLLVVQDKKE